MRKELTNEVETHTGALVTTSQNAAQLNQAVADIIESVASDESTDLDW